MAIIVKTNGLDELSSLDVLISDGIDGGGVETWDYDKQGDFFHSTSSAQWEESGWIHFHQTKGQKKLNIACFRTQKVNFLSNSIGFTKFIF